MIILPKKEIYIPGKSLSLPHRQKGFIELAKRRQLIGGITIELTATYQDPTSGGSSSDPYNTGSVSFGETGTGRIILVIVGGQEASSHLGTAPISCTIDGNTASEWHTVANTTANGVGMGIYILQQDSGTSGEVEWYHDSLQNGRGFCSVYRVMGASTTVYDTGGDTDNSDPMTFNIDCPQKGAIIAGGYHDSNTGVTWTNLDEDHELTVDSSNIHSSAHRGYLTAQTSLSIQYNPGSYTDGCLIGAALSPA